MSKDAAHRELLRWHKYADLLSKNADVKGRWREASSAIDRRRWREPQISGMLHETSRCRLAAGDGLSAELAGFLGRIPRGDFAAFESLYKVTSRKLYRIVLRIVTDGTLADDVLQEVYVTIWKRAADFDPARGSPVTWMAIIARNRAIDELRRGSKVDIRPVDDAAGVFGHFDDPIAARERSDAYSAVFRCIESLEPLRREIFLLAYYHGLSRDALAKRFSRPASTIKTWLHRDLSKVRRCVATEA